MASADKTYLRKLSSIRFQNVDTWDLPSKPTPINKGYPVAVIVSRLKEYTQHAKRVRTPAEHGRLVGNLKRLRRQIETGRVRKEQNDVLALKEYFQESTVDYAQLSILELKTIVIQEIDALLATLSQKPG